MPTLLFDIDGTLIRTGGAGKHAMEAALRTAFGVSHIRDEVPYSGRTDPAIGRDLLRVHGVDPTAENFAKLSTAYLGHLQPSLHANGGEVLPGVTDLLIHLHGKKRRMGLLTGNVRAGARHKLSHFGLWDYFAFGGFGDVHHDRDDVARAALTALKDHSPDYKPADVWVIGDTPLDVKCARAIGAKVVAVATGWHSLDELAASEADLTLADLSDFQKLPSHWFH
ncbi:HAD family hydrolase [Limnoglobus roseus]|uniref:phosphoglycolate phosphatase n=1 Tax=Limnoglobus roseus TaxID=2598579 RepID=A0A5C1A5V9_9BACT|nr:HAD family hydrolase [Limnoglobus roseus]QEL13657.1 haloacid dehalogenase [Limnoglobus roseus]